MKQPKLYVMGQRTAWPQRREARGRFTYRSYFRYQWMRFKAFIWRWTKRVAIVTAFFLVLWLAYFIGQANGKVLAATNVITIAAKTADSEAPVLARIADCESGDNGKPGTAHQFNKDGTIVQHVNTNGSIDIGYMQINLTVAHINKAAQLGYDLTTEAGNRAFGKYIYENEAGIPWISSYKCWHR